MKRTNSPADALNRNKIVVSVGDGLPEIELPLDGNFGGGQGEKGEGIPAGGEPLQVVRKTAAGTTTEWVTLTPGTVGLSNVDNTADAEKPLSEPQKQALLSKADLVGGRVPGAQIPTDELAQTFGRRNANDALSSGNNAYSYIRDTGTGLASTFLYEDAPEHLGSVISIRHYGRGDDGNQAYGINVANHVGARNAVTIHQYSKAAPAFQIDNTDIASGIYIKNTENQTQNPGGSGTGNFLQFKPFSSTDSLFLTDGLQWLNRTGGKDMSVASLTPVNYTFAVLATADDKQGMYVSKSGVGAGAALNVNNMGTGSAVSIVQNGLSEGLKITTTAAANGVYAARMNGQAHGLILDTVNNGGNTLDVDKKGLGNGIAFKLRNLGTGDTISMLNGAGVVARFSAAGEYENYGNGSGIILRDPAGIRYRISVDNTGTVKATVI